MKTLGSLGERKAAFLLRRKGFQIIERNFSCRIGELDLVAIKRFLIVFCEVKTRKSTQYGLPVEAITEQKQQKLRNLAELYLSNCSLRFEDVRFDVITVNELTKQIEHIEDAF